MVVYRCPCLILYSWFLYSCLRHIDQHRNSVRTWSRNIKIRNIASSRIHQSRWPYEGTMLRKLSRIIHPQHFVPVTKARVLPTAHPLLQFLERSSFLRFLPNLWLSFATPVGWVISVVTKRTRWEGLWWLVITTVCTDDCRSREPFVITEEK